MNKRETTAHRIDQLPASGGPRQKADREDSNQYDVTRSILN